MACDLQPTLFMLRLTPWLMQPMAYEIKWCCNAHTYHANINEVFVEGLKPNADEKKR